MDKWKELRKPLSDDEIEWRVQQCGKTTDGNVWALLVPYIDARAVMKRFDAVFTPEGWRDEYKEASTDKEKGFICRVWYRTDDNEWGWKEDGAPATDIESIKGGISDAFKRAAVKMGVGRELYEMKDIWAQDIKDGYPPRGDRRAIKIVSTKFKEKKYWCYPPEVNSNGGEPPQEKPPVKDGATKEQIDTVIRLFDSVPVFDLTEEQQERIRRFVDDESAQTSNEAAILIAGLKQVASKKAS